jgi:hypothetical protein
MKVAVDISLYPLQEDLIPPIKDVIARLKSHDNLYVDTNSACSSSRCSTTRSRTRWAI